MRKSKSWTSMEMNRRGFLKYALGGAAMVAAACTGNNVRNDDQTKTILSTVDPADASGPPGPFRVTSPTGGRIQAKEGNTQLVSWRPAPGADMYDVELNGVIVAEHLAALEFVLGFGQAMTGLQEGPNTCRVRARNGAGETWSDIASFEVVTLGGIRARHFDQEDDGDIQLTVASMGTALTVGSKYAFGQAGKGATLKCSDPDDTRAYKNHSVLPTGECWVRVALRPEEWEGDSVSISLARIRSGSAKATEFLLWTTGVGITSTSTENVFPVPKGEWSQVQLGVKSDGGVELWVFDGRQEFLVGRGVNKELAGQAKDIVSIGSNSPNKRIMYEIWLDEFAVAEQRMPWARVDDTHQLQRPKALDPAMLPPVFSFVFGSCNVSTRVPYVGTALEAAADASPDFLLHLGDYGYPDSGAYRQSEQGYLALWTDMFYEEQLSRSFRKPWIYVASDHDLGGNNIDSDTAAPFAAKAFASWQRNDRSVDPEGRYGAIDFDEGRVFLMWTDTISFRSPLLQRDGVSKTMLGNAQKEWFLNTLTTSSAGLIIIASQTPIGHASNSGWTRYATERREVLDACAEANGLVRWISGDHHSARWADLGNDTVEWGAAPLAEIAQVCPPAASDVVGASCVSRPTVPPLGETAERDEVLAALGQDRIDSSTSFGRVQVDTVNRTATFEVRDNAGAIRTAESGFRMTETLAYG